MTSKKQDKPTKSGAVVLEESELDQAQGGAAGTTFIKFKGATGEVLAKPPPAFKS